MNLQYLSRKNPTLHALLQQSAHWRQLDATIKAMLPANLHKHFAISCIENGDLMVLASNNMAASRLRMMLPSLVPKLQSIDSTILGVRVKIKPQQTPAEKTKQAALSPAAQSACADAAEKLAHHADLAAALLALSRKSSG